MSEVQNQTPPERRPESRIELGLGTRHTPRDAPGDAPRDVPRDVLGVKKNLFPSVTNQPSTYQASLYLSYGMLITPVEFSMLLESLQDLPDFSIWGTGVLLPKEKLAISEESLINHYAASLENFTLSGEQKAALSSVWTMNLNAVRLREFPQEKGLIVRELPVVQLCRFQFRFDGERFFSNSFSQDTLFWGIELRFPQLFLDPTNGKLIKVLKAEYSNTLLWKKIHEWIRNHTMPVQFLKGDGGKRVAPFRIGKSAEDLGDAMLQKQNSLLQLKRVS